MKRIAVVAACDRNNYGDVLLPVLYRNMLIEYRKEGDFKLDCFALSYSDMTYLGGMKTKPIYKLNGQYDSIVFVGGEILSARYVNMFLNLQEDKEIINKYSDLARIDYEKCDKKCRVMLKGVNDYPWVFYPQFSKQKVFYNAAGGANKGFSSHQREAWERCISEATMFTVRNNQSHIYFDEICGLDIELVPDSAILIKEYFNNKIEQSINRSISNSISNIGKYIVIQVNRLYGSGIEEEIAKTINEIYDRLNIQTVLLPIGLAQGHEDSIPLQNIHNLSPKASIYIYINSIYDTMYLIKKSIMFIGTSLHGIITAASYGVPHTAMLKKADKTVGYINTWQTTKYQYLERIQELYNILESENYLDFINIDNILAMKNKAKKMLEKEFDLIFANN